MNKKEFDYEKKLLELKAKKNLEKHELKMKELEYARKSDEVKHDLDLQQIRIKSAEIKRGIMLKSQERRY